MTTVVVAVGRPASAEKWIDVFKQIEPNWNYIAWQPGQAQPVADVAVVWQPQAQLFQDQPQLKALFNIGAGVDAIDFSQVPEQVAVYRVEDGGMAVQMAEYAIYGVLLATQRLAPYHVLQQQKKWQPQPPLYRQEWPIGIMGYGQIGQCVAQSLRMLGYPVSVWVRSPRTEPDLNVYVGPEQLPDFLAASRILINVLPLTAQTKGLINQHTLAQLQADGYFINLARGAHVVDQDLIHAIDQQQLRGALLDVFHTEPLPAEHPFWTHPQIHITPHISGVSLREPVAKQISQKINQLLKGQTPSGLVNPARQY